MDLQTVNKFSSPDETRWNLTQPYYSGKALVATDGHRMMIWRESPTFPAGYVAIVKKQALPVPEEKGRVFPPWEQVVPSIEGAEKITVTIPRWVGRLKVTGKQEDRVPSMFDVAAKYHAAFDACLLAPLAEERVDMYLTGVLEAAVIVPAGVHPHEAPWMAVVMSMREDAQNCVKIPAGR